MLEPLFSRVLLEREVAKKISSIMIPKSAQFKFASLRSRVIAVGPDVNRDNCYTTISVGDVVIVGKHAGCWLHEDGTPTEDPDTAKYYLVQDEDILAKVVDEEKLNDRNI